jgi:signal-transduction protein with cAMP-binding, CBS, and nucleotidyltransferase domain
MVRAALAPILQAATVEESPLDLSALDAFADLPDDARDAFARAANLCHYAKGEAVEPFALAFVVQGDVDVSASEVPFVATRIGAGRVLRARGTLDEPIPLRLVCASNALVATWDRDAMEGGLGPCPWVEDDLRTSGDRVQALVGSTLGALGPRLSVELRTSIVERLVIRVFAEHEAIVTEGVSVPGLLLVAAGAVDLVSDYAPPTRVGAGQFVLAAEALSAGASPATVRAAHGGALVLMGDRKTTQELFATEPLLLEIFAGW